MLIKQIKKIARRSQTMVKLYRGIQLLWGIFRKDFHIHKIELILAIKPYTMLSYPRLFKLYEAASRLEKEKIDGSFVECGVWKGGSAGIIAGVAKRNKNRHIWLFDSWKGLPAPAKYDISCTGKPGKEGMVVSSKEKAKELLFKKLKLDSNKVHLVEGWFTDTISSHKKDIGKIALLHLDCDWYESVKFCLEELYDDIVKDGFIFIDDYGYWKGCKKAVDEFIDEKNLRIKLIKIDYTGVYFQK